MSPLEIAVESFGGVLYFSAIACDGWPTGPCPSEAKARERVTAYERCEEVSEAAPGQGSRAQMRALRQWLVDTDFRGSREEIHHIDEAIRAGLHTEEWCRASRLFATANPPRFVIQAGGAYIRRRLPDTAIPSRGAQ
jgi:hypothetical protein